MSTTLDKRIARGEREAYFTSNHSKLHPLQEKLIQVNQLFYFKYSQCAQYEIAFAISPCLKVPILCINIIVVH